MGHLVGVPNPRWNSKHCFTVKHHWKFEIVCQTRIDSEKFERRLTDSSFFLRKDKAGDSVLTMNPVPATYFKQNGVSLGLAVINYHFFSFIFICYWYMALWPFLWKQLLRHGFFKTWYTFFGYFFSHQFLHFFVFWQNSDMVPHVGK